MLDIGLSDVLIYFILKAELMIVPVKMFALKPLLLPRCTAQSPQNAKISHCPFLGVSILGALQSEGTIAVAQI